MKHYFGVNVTLAIGVAENAHMKHFCDGHL